MILPKNRQELNKFRKTLAKINVAVLALLSISYIDKHNMSFDSLFACAGIGAFVAATNYAINYMVEKTVEIKEKQ